MSRRKAAVKRDILPDPVYGSKKLSQFINVLMRSGKRSIAERIVYTALEEAFKKLQLKKQAGKRDDEDGDSSSGRTSSSGSRRGNGKLDVLSVLDKVLENIRPAVEVKSRRVGGATYQVPVEVNVDRGIALAMRWIIKVAKGRSEQTMARRLAAEMVDVMNGRGASIKMRDDMHKMAKANQAFAQYRW